MKHTLMMISFLFFTFRAFSQDTRGLSVPHTASTLAEQPGTPYALVVGISTYPNVTPLKYADRDAALFRQYLMSKAGGGVKEENMLYLVNEEAKGATLLVKALSWIENRPYQKGDKLYIYLAGHGDAIDQDEYFFLGYDVSTGNDGAKNNYLAGFTLQMYNLKISIKRIEAKGVQVNLIIDACRTNELAGGTSGQQSFSTGVTEMRNGEMMMLSASPGQSSIESQNIGGGHGLFTYYLIDGLSGEADRNKDGRITLFELQSYVSDKVANEAQTKYGGHEQIPYFCCSEMNTQTIAVVDSAYHEQWLASRSMNDAVSGNEIAMADNKGKRGIEGTINDTNLIRTYNLFTAAIKKEKLLGDSSAEFYYKMMEKTFPKASLTEDARYTLASEYLNFTQGKINIFLQGKDHASEAMFKKLSIKAEGSESENKYDLIKVMPHRIAVAMMDSAMILLKDQPELIKSLRPKYLFLKAYSCFFSRMYKDGLAAADEGLKLSPDAAYLYEVKADLEMITKNYSAAIYNYNKAMLLNPKWADPYLTLGVTYMQEAKYDSAIGFIKTAMQIDTTYPYPYGAMSAIYSSKGQPDSAEKYALKSIRTDSTFIEGYYFLGMAYATSGKLDKAQKSLENFVRSDPDNPSAYGVYELLGSIFFQKGNIIEAEENFRKAVSIDPTLAKDWAILGQIAAEVKKNYDDAITDVKKSINLDSSDANVWDLYGNILDAQKKYPEGLRCHKKSLAINPNIGAYYDAACNYSLQADGKDALFYLEESLKKGIEKGGNDYAHLQVDTDLDNIRNTPEFKALMKKYFPNDYKE